MKKYRMKLSFTKEEIYRATLGLDVAGISTTIPRTMAELKEVREAFGWVGSTNNGNTYYPEIEGAESVIPKPEDFVTVPFRLLSATIVAGGSWRSTDFSNEEVLKASMPKLDLKPLYYNHDTDILNAVGQVASTKWGNAFTDSKGQQIPGGIDGFLEIDTKANPRLARSVLKGSVFSNSVTVDFEYEPSHKFTDFHEFENKIGTYAEDGKMITRKVTKIIDYYESSLVWLGADPFAKKILDNGDLLHVDHSSVVSLSKEEIEAVDKEQRQNFENSKKYSINSCITLSQGLSLNKEYKVNSTKTNENNNILTMKKELELFLRVMLGLTETEEIKKEHLEKLSKIDTATHVVLSIQERDSSASKITELTESLNKEKETVTSLTTQVTALTTERDSLKVLADVGTSHLSMKREEAKRLYSLHMADKVDSNVLKLIEEAQPEALDGLLAQYVGSVTEKLTATCTECQSTSFSFRSSLSSGDKGHKTPNVGVKAASFSELADNTSSMILGKK